MYFRFAADMIYPTFQYQYGLEDENYVTVDFYVPALCRDYIEVMLHPNKKEMHLKIKVVDHFFELVWLRYTDENFSKKFHKAVAFQSACDTIRGSHPKGVFGTTPTISLPFEADDNSMKTNVYLHKYPELHAILQREKRKLVGYDGVFNVTFEAADKRKTPRKLAAIEVVGFIDEEDDNDENEGNENNVKSGSDVQGEIPKGIPKEIPRDDDYVQRKLKFDEETTFNNENTPRLSDIHEKRLLELQHDLHQKKMRLLHKKNKNDIALCTFVA